MPSPRPRLPPVTMTLRSVSGMAHELAAGADREHRHEADRGRDLVLAEIVAAEPQDLALECLAAGVLAGTRVAQHDVGNDQRAGDRALAPAHERHAHLRMAVDHRFDLLGRDLEAADIDDAV